MVDYSNKEAFSAVNNNNTESSDNMFDVGGVEVNSKRFDENGKPYEEIGFWPGVFGYTGSDANEKFMEDSQDIFNFGVAFALGNKSKQGLKVVKDGVSKYGKPAMKKIQSIFNKPKVAEEFFELSDDIMKKIHNKEILTSEMIKKGFVKSKAPSDASIKTAMKQLDDAGDGLMLDRFAKGQLSTGKKSSDVVMKEIIDKLGESKDVFKSRYKPDPVTANASTSDAAEEMFSRLMNDIGRTTVGIKVPNESMILDKLLPFTAAAVSGASAGYIYDKSGSDFLEPEE